MPKYRIICKSCNTVHGQSDTPIVSNVPAKCSSCGMERIAIEPIPEEIYTQMDFDLFVTNKRTGLSEHHGFIMSVEDMKGKTEEQIRDVFIERSAKTLAELLNTPKNIETLLRNKN